MKKKTGNRPKIAGKSSKNFRKIVKKEKLSKKPEIVQKYLGIGLKIVKKNVKKRRENVKKRENRPKRVGKLSIKDTKSSNIAGKSCKKSHQDLKKDQNQSRFSYTQYILLYRFSLKTVLKH